MNEVVERAIARHGGLDRWSAVEGIEVDMLFAGALLDAKGYLEPLVATLAISTASPRTVVSPYGGPGERATFTPDLVWSETLGGIVTGELRDPRSSFEGHDWTTKWTQLQRLYFVGYAMWDYLTIPFLFMHPGFVFETLPAHHEDGETWDAIKVTFPHDIPAHCDVQTFYFDASGLLKRMDYQTDIAGGVASHYPYDPQTVGGLVFPTRRRIVQRTPDGPKVTGRTGVFIEYSAVRVRDWSDAATLDRSTDRAGS